MNFFKYTREKLYQIFLFLLSYCILLLILRAFKNPFEVSLFLSFLFFFPYITCYFFEYFRRKKFYMTLEENVQRLEKAYFVLETLEIPSFLEGKILCDILYEINKSMCEEVNRLEIQVKNFKEYIELWIHEVKIPIASLLLMEHNREGLISTKELKQIKKIEDYVEQILYYSRCENASVDYLIKPISLSKVISEVALKNKEDLLANRIEFLVEKENIFVLTDSKWLIFVVNQIVNNSIKYRKMNADSFLKISMIDEEKYSKLIIEDNGIGIKESDLKKVFDKTFTGENGRLRASSTGMGLFIVKSLCDKLGHSIQIESEVMKYTKVTITFFKDSFYDSITKK